MQEKNALGSSLCTHTIAALFRLIAGSSAIRMRERARSPTARAMRRTQTTRQREGKARADGPRRRPTNYVRARPDDNRRREAARRAHLPGVLSIGLRRVEDTYRQLCALGRALISLLFAFSPATLSWFLSFFRLPPPRERETNFILPAPFHSTRLPREMRANLKRNGHPPDQRHFAWDGTERKNKARIFVQKLLELLNYHPLRPRERIWRMMIPGE